MKDLDENILRMKDNPKLNIQVSGYTSMSGTAEYNQKLSERRASAVSDYLISQGIAPSRIKTRGYGETRPKTVEKPGSDVNSRAARSNMRVLFDMHVD